MLSQIIVHLTKKTFQVGSGTVVVRYFDDKKRTTMVERPERTGRGKVFNSGEWRVESGERRVESGEVLVCKWLCMWLV